MNSKQHSMQMYKNQRFEKTLQKTMQTWARQNLWSQIKLRDCPSVCHKRNKIQNTFVKSKELLTLVKKYNLFRNVMSQEQNIFLSKQ